METVAKNQIASGKKGAGTKFKKHLVKVLTFWIFPKSLRNDVKRQLKYKLGIGVKPENPSDRRRYEKTRAKYREDFKAWDKTRYQIVSLGGDCLCRTIPTMWGVKPTRAEGEKGFPFDLSNIPLGVVREAIAADFKNYDQGLSFDSSWGCWVNAKKGCYYCHEHDLTGSAEDLAKLKERFNRRIDNLREAMQTDKPVIFIVHYGNGWCPQDRPDDVKKLFQAVKKIRGDKPMAFVAVDTRHDMEAEDGIINVDTSMLSDDYLWHIDEHRYTKEGLAFEQGMIDLISAEIKRLTA